MRRNSSATSSPEGPRWTKSGPSISCGVPWRPFHVTVTLAIASEWSAEIAASCRSVGRFAPVATADSTVAAISASSERPATVLASAYQLRSSLSESSPNGIG